MRQIRPARNTEKRALGTASLAISVADLAHALEQRAAGFAHRTAKHVRAAGAPTSGPKSARRLISRS
jgi:hypothetical protein